MVVQLLIRYVGQQQPEYIRSSTMSVSESNSLTEHDILLLNRWNLIDPTYNDTWYNYKYKYNYKTVIVN